MHKEAALRRFQSGLWVIFAVCALAGWPLAANAAGTPNVSVSAPWIRYLLPNLPAGGYMVLKNSGDGDAMLIGASSPDCGSMMLHQSKDSSGMSMMMDVSGIRVPAGGSVSLADGGYHLMCMQPKMHVGERVPLMLSFQDKSSILLIVPVYGAAGPQ